METPTILVTSYGETYEIQPKAGYYGNGRTAIQFYDDEGLFGTLTVNLPDDHLNDGEVFVKDWSENEPLVAALLEAGWLKSTGREVQSGYVFPKVMTLHGPLAGLS